MFQVNKIEEEADIGVLRERVEMRNKFKINRIEESDEEGQNIKMEREDVEIDLRTKTNRIEEEINAPLVPETREGKKVVKWESLELEDIVNRERESLEDIVKRVISQRKITNLHIVSSNDKQQTQISFSVQFAQVEDLVLELQNHGQSLTISQLKKHWPTFSGFIHQ